ncbi:MAG TPA: hypothetical protein VLH81_01560 [Desulfobacterales bacterium]|nr:hypothetical protein [Desulfobacterales bacterium]
MTEPRFIVNPNAEGILRSLLAPAVEAGARILVDAIKDTLEEAPPRTGREYYVPGTKTKYTASAPDEVPAVREGKYRDSWKATKAFETPRGIAAAAVSDLVTDDGDPIGLLLEDGTADIVLRRFRMEPRPHLREAINRAGPPIEAKLAELRRAS